MTSETMRSPGRDLVLDGTPPIDGLHFRRPRSDDAEYAELAAMIERCSLADGISWIPTAEHLREEMEGTGGLVPAEDAVLAYVGDELVGEAGVERVIRDDTPTFEFWGHVHPDWRRRGIGTCLARENLRRAAERIALEPAGQPTVMAAFAEESEVGHHAILRDLGFQAARWFFLMRRPLREPIPDAPLPDGLELRPLTPDQHRIVFDAEAEAFRDHWASRTPTDEDFALLYGREEFDPSLWVVAWDGDEVAGVVQGWIWGNENETLGVQRGWLEHISVRRPWRRRGLARSLTAEGLRRFAAAGMTEAMLGVDADSPTGALGLYEGLGFSVHTRSIAYRRDG
jgi:mycothiol synthase